MKNVDDDFGKVIRKDMSSKKKKIERFDEKLKPAHEPYKKQKLHFKDYMDLADDDNLDDEYY